MISGAVLLPFGEGRKFRSAILAPLPRLRQIGAFPAAVLFPALWFGLERDFANGADFKRNPAQMIDLD